MLNQFELIPDGEYPGLGPVFDVVVDGESLLSKVAEFELRYSDSINGSYVPGLNTVGLNRSMLETPGRIFPLVCGCGEWQCWVLSVEVSFCEDFVYWSQWTNPNRDDKSKKGDGLYWSYKEFPALVFDKKDYLRKVLAAIELLT